MTEIDRETLKNDPVFRELFETIKRNHKVANHTKKNLFKNKHIKDFCEQARHYVMISGKNPIYLHYDISSWYSPKGAQVRIEGVGVYDDFIEYEAARIRGLHSTMDADGANLN